MSPLHDVVVIGAGPGGSATAHFLAQHKLDVLLLDKSDFPRDKTCGDGLTPRALGVLDEVGILDEVCQIGYRIDEAIIFAPKGTAVTLPVPVQDGLPPYMLAVPRMQLDDIIRRRAITSGAQFQSRVHVTGIEQTENGIVVKGQRHKKPFAARGRTAVIATGASTKLLLNLGVLNKIPDMHLAVRAYFEGMQHLSGRFEFHLDTVSLPGYSWIFPLSATLANVGAGVVRMRRTSQQTAKGVMQQFLQTPTMQKMLATARQVGPVKGFPLRTDFATAPTYGPRMLLVGEAAGLVNPLTGEGIDFALESAKIAAEHLIELFAAGDFSQPCLAQYDQKLRTRFQRTFVFNSRIRDWYLNKLVVNRLVHAANRRDELRLLFTDIMLGNTDAAQGLSLKTMLQIGLTW